MEISNWAGSSYHLGNRGNKTTRRPCFFPPLLHQLISHRGMSKKIHRFLQSQRFRTVCDKLALARNNASKSVAHGPLCVPEGRQDLH